MPTADPLDGRILHLELDLIVSPAPGSPMGHTAAAEEFARRLALEAGLLAQRMAGEGSSVIVERDMKIF
jgi:hypothetical protein